MARVRSAVFTVGLSPRSSVDQALLSILLLILRVQALLSITEVDLAAIDPRPHWRVGNVERVAIAEEKRGAVASFERTKPITDADDFRWPSSDCMQCGSVRESMSGRGGGMMGEASLMRGLVLGGNCKGNSSLMKCRGDREGSIDRMMPR